MHRRLLLSLVVILVGWLPAGGVQAQEPPESLNIVLVVDDSGSMADNDGQKLRLVAAKLLISLLEPQDQVAVIRFATHSQVVIPFTPMDPDAKLDLMARLDQGFQSDGRTDIRAALAQAEMLIAEVPAGKGQVVLLTDGLPYIRGWPQEGPPASELKTYTKETLEVAENIGGPVLTIALGDEVDRDFLRTISSVSGGHYFEAATALDLPVVYLEMLSELQDRTIVGPGQLTAPGEAMVDVHPYAQSVGFVIVKDPETAAALYPPNASEPLDTARPGVVAFNEPQFDVILVPDLAPGPWRVALSGSGQADVKAIVIKSRLRLDLLGPAKGEACIGQPWLISARLSLERDGGLTPITGAEAAEKVDAQIALPNGQVETLTLRDETHSGEFTAFFDVADQPGTYQIVLQTSVGGLDTRRTGEVTGRACPGLAIVAPQDGASLEMAPDEPIAIAVRLLEGEGQSLDQGTVVALVMDAAGEQTTLPLTEIGNGQYQGEYLPSSSGPVEVKARLEDAVWQGLPVQAEALPVRMMVMFIQPDPWATYRKLGWVALAAAAILALLLLIRRARQPRLDGELVYGPPGARPDYEPVQSREIYLKIEDGGYLAIRRRRRGAQAMLRAERDGDVRLLPLNGAHVTKNNIPVRQEGSLVGPRDVIRLEGLVIRYENYKEE